MTKYFTLLSAILLLSCKETTQIDTVPKKENITLETKNNFSINGSYSKPLANNVNSRLALSSTDGNQLFIHTEITGKTSTLISKTQNVGNNFAWSKDGSSIIYKEKTKDYKTKIVSLNTETLIRKELVNLPKHTALKALKISDTIYFLDQKSLAVKAKFQNKEWNISTEKGNYYNLEVSPNNKYIIAHKGSFIYLFTTSGTFIKKLGKGIATGWHEDSQNIVGFLDASIDGHQITGSELYLFHIKKEPVQLTNTKDKIETWPSFKNNTEVMFREEKKNGVFSTNIQQYIK